jgi:electron transfer flavoprotein alpha/beta subunit
MSGCPEATPKDYVLVGTMQTDEKAEELGNALASITGLPFAVQEESETRVED